MWTKKKILNFIGIISIIGIPIVVYFEYKNYKKRLNREENVIESSTKLGFKESDLWNLFGGLENIKSVSSTHTKVGFIIEDINKVDISKLRKHPKIDGVLESNNKISIVVGNIAKTIEERFNNT